VQIQRSDGLWYSAEYSTFSISDEVGKYQITLAGYSGDAGDAFLNPGIPNWAADGKMFTTLDSDNDLCPCNCAVNWGGWWWGWCSLNNINGDDIVTWIATDVEASRILVKHI